MSNLRSLPGLFTAAMKLAAACAFATAIAGAVSGQTPTNILESTGNAGVGTTTPARKLEVLDSGSPQLRLTHTGGSVYTDFQTLSSGNLIISPTGPDTTSTKPFTVSAASDAFRFYPTADTNLRWSFTTDASGFFNIVQKGDGWANQGTRFSINRSGNVGIGTTSPATKFQVNHDNNSTTFVNSPDFTVFLRNNNTATNNWVGLGFGGNRDDGTGRLAGSIGAQMTSHSNGSFASDLVFAVTGPGEGPLEVLRMKSTGKVGIGTTSPGSLLQIANSAQPTFTVETTGTTGKGRLTAAVPDWLGITQNARFDGTNWNLDNTSAPGWLLKLDSRGSADVFEIARFSPGANPRGYAPLFTIDSAGDVGIGTNTSNVAYKLDVNGAINATALNVNGSPVIASQWAPGSGNINYTSGNVGIGTTTPNAKLDVQGNFSVTGGGTNDTVKVLSTSSVSGGTYIQNTQASAQAVMYLENNRGSYASYGGFIYGGSSNAIGNLFGVSRTDKMFLFADGASNLGMAVGTLVAQPLILGTNNAERMRVDSSGNVGIGISNPTYKLHVQGGQINASGGLCINGQCKGSWSEVGGSQWSGSSNIFYNTGNVGIGTESPGSGGYGQSRFDVVGRLRSRAADANITAGLWLNDSPSASGATDQAFIGRSLSATTGFWNATGWVLNVHDSGKVGIGIESPEEKLHVTGNIKVTGTGNITALGTIEGGNIKAKYQDLAEWVPSSEQLSAGTVVVLDTTKSNQVVSATISYDTRVAGVISARPGITLGESGEGKVLVATTGRVRVKVDASRGAIQIGDLLVTSDVAGVAMKSEAVEFAGRKMHMPGTIIGKALEPLAKGSGEILVLLSLQ